MQLLQLLRESAGWADDEGTLFVAEPWSGEAEAIVVRPCPEETDDVVVEGKAYAYFLETYVATEFMTGYVKSNEGRVASEQARCERLIRYAIDDA